MTDWMKSTETMCGKPVRMLDDKAKGAEYPLTGFVDLGDFESLRRFSAHGSSACGEYSLKPSAEQRYTGWAPLTKAFIGGVHSELFDAEESDRLHVSGCIPVRFDIGPDGLPTNFVRV